MNQSVNTNDIKLKIQNKIKIFKDLQLDTITITHGTIKQLDYNDDIKREQAFYEFSLNNLNSFKKQNSDIHLGKLDTEYLFKQIGEIVCNTIVKSAVHQKNLNEKELNQQGKKIQALVTAKKSNQQKHEKLVEEIKKAMKKKPVEEFDQEEIKEIQQQHKQKSINVLKKGIKKRKTKRLGKVARLHQKLKKNSKKQG